jgi:high-affinity iron transporter
VGSFVITLREGFEATLIVGIILAYLTKTGYRETHRRAVWIGVGLAVAFSVLVGSILFATIGELEGDGEAIFEGTAMLVAAVLVTWMAFWMRRQAATIGAHLREQVSASLAAGGAALAAVAFVAVAREGIETALFLFASSEESSPLVAAIAGFAGLVAAILLGVLVYRGALRLDLARFFTITSLLVIAFAAYLIFSGLHEFGEVAESEALELAAPLAALAYAGGLGTLYLRDARRPARPPDAAAEAASS